MSKKSVAVTAIVAATIGIGIGSAGSASSDTVAKPKIKTVTQTETVTKEVEVEVVPQACLDAIDDSEAVAKQVARSMNISATWPDMVVRGVEIGMSMDTSGMKDLTADVKDMTAKYEDITREVTPIVSSFNANKASCRSAG